MAFSNVQLFTFLLHDVNAIELAVNYTLTIHVYQTVGYNDIDM